MSNHYILDGHNAVLVDLDEWARWYEVNHRNRHVRDEKIGDVRISTVFLGLDHSFGDGPPMIFETLVFGGKLDQEMDRCSTWEEAETMHSKMVAKVIEAEDATG